MYIKCNLPRLSEDYHDDPLGEVVGFRQPGLGGRIWVYYNYILNKSSNK